MPDGVEDQPVDTVQSKAEKPKDAIARVMGMRLAYSHHAAAEIDTQAKVYEQFVFGAPPATDEEEEAGSSLKTADEKKMGRGWSMTTYPLHGSLRQVLLPTLLNRPPTWVNRARVGADEREKALGKVYEELAKVIYTENDVHAEAAAALDDAMLRRCGWFNVDYDSKKKLPRIRWVDARRVRVDRENGKSPFTRDQRWWAEIKTISIKDAEYLAQHEWGAKGYKFQPLKTDADTDDDILTQESELFDADGERWSREAHKPTTFTRLIFVYVKGANPYGGAASNKAKPGDIVERGGDDAVYDGSDRLLILECIGDADTAENYKYVGEKKWPFPCDPGECPAEPLRITADTRDFFPYSIFQPGHALQVAVNWALSYYNTDLHNSSRRIVVYNDGHLGDKELDQALWGEDNLVVLKSKNKNANENWFRVQTFGQPNPSLKEAIPANTQHYRDATGLDALDVEARSNRTATDAAIQNQGAQVRIGFMADAVERALSNAMRKALQCARWNMSAEDVAKWVGDGLLRFTEMQVTETAEVEDFGGETAYQIEQPVGTVRVSDVWDEEVKNPESIRDEIGIDVEPKSVRFVNPQTEIEDIQLLVAKQAEFHKRVTDAPTPQEKLVIARASNAALRMLAQRLNLPNAHELLYDLNEIANLPMPAEMLQQPGMMAAGGGGGPVQPAAIGAAGRIAGNMGMANPLAE